MDRLRSRKAEVAESLDQRRAAARFEPAPDAPPPETLGEQAGLPTAPPAPPKPKPATGPMAPDQKEEESYTNRLLKAKKKVWEERNKE
jgi:hypothetical protein